MPNAAADIMRAWFRDVWNGRRADLVGSYLAQDAIVHGLDETGGAAVGHAGFLAFFQKMQAAAHDITIELQDVIAARDWAAGRWSASMTHSGDGLGIPATGQRVTVTGMTMVREANGLIVEAWNEWDRLALLTAVGVIGPRG